MNDNNIIYSDFLYGLLAVIKYKNRENFISTRNIKLYMKGVVGVSRTEIKNRYSLNIK